MVSFDVKKVTEKELRQSFDEGHIVASYSIPSEKGEKWDARLSNKIEIAKKGENDGLGIYFYVFEVGNKKVLARTGYVSRQDGERQFAVHLGERQFAVHLVDHPTLPGVINLTYKNAHEILEITGEIFEDAVKKYRAYRDSISHYPKTVNELNEIAKKEGVSMGSQLYSDLSDQVFRPKKTFEDFIEVGQPYDVFETSEVADHSCYVIISKDKAESQ